jgi:guanosine-3',5'-bis(diphosphate) 3'-pyrophosphohydrolase
LQERVADTPATTKRPTPRGEPGSYARYLISDLCVDLESYLASEQIREVYRAYLFSAEAHEGQRRRSGEPYIYHPVAVARILAGIRMDHKCLMAAILHDVLEDTETAKEYLAGVFDAEIAELVDGVSKLTQINFRSHAEAQAENFRKMILAMTRDIRVILIKLADRLHNMRTLGAMPPDKARRIARETLEIYAPIANRLGINNIRLELEDLGMAAYWPLRHRILSDALRRMRGNRKEVVGNIETAIRRRLRQEDLHGEVYGREKHVYSIYRKLREKGVSLHELADVYAFRILVDKVDTCYRVLGAVHNLYKPVPGRFKDYIAIPKANGYQSLHTVLFGPHSLPIEIQIRTEEMHRVAEEGIAAHWHYKTTGSTVTPDTAADWLRNLLEMQKGSGNSMEFLEHVKIDLFPDEVYVFTPRGRILVLPKRATVIDFAYAVHSDVGNQCVAARVDRRLAPLRTRLKSGQTVEIITKPDAQPNPAWLDFVVTGKARAAIRGYLKRLERQEAAVLGRRLLERELELHGTRLDDLPAADVQRVLEELRLEDLDRVLEEVGLGNRMAKLIARMLSSGGEAEERGRPRAPGGTLAIRGTEGMVVKYAKCCGPIPGDPIVANFSPGRGVVVHHQACPNLGDFRKQGQSWLDVQWADEVAGEFTTGIRIDVGNQRGMLATVATLIAEEGSNIEDVRSEERDGLSSTLRFVVSVRDRKHLASIMKRLRAIPAVLKLARVIG